MGVRGRLNVTILGSSPASSVGRTCELRRTEVGMSPVRTSKGHQMPRPELNLQATIFDTKFDPERVPENSPGSKTPGPVAPNRTLNGCQNGSLRTHSDDASMELRMFVPYPLRLSEHLRASLSAQLIPSAGSLSWGASRMSIEIAC